MSEAAVRTAIAGAIRGIATTELGFDHPDGNVREYFVEYHPDESEDDYFAAEVEAAMLARTWAVQVTSELETVLAASGVIYSRLYRAAVKGYYALRSGDDFNLLVQHALKVRGAIANLGLRMGGTVTLIESIGPWETPEIISAPSGKLLVGQIVYRLRLEPATF